MEHYKKIRILLMAVFGVAVMALFGRASIVSGIAAVTTDKKQTEQVDVVDKEVKEWLDEGHS
ncbi:MAG: hypothetical protein K6G42_09050, partial [Lachnospiraceae bacterium]|nr:hypothetical protein [Lachnospiraceae bacterium]